MQTAQRTRPQPIILLITRILPTRRRIKGSGTTSQQGSRNSIRARMGRRNTVLRVITTDDATQLGIAVNGMRPTRFEQLLVLLLIVIQRNNINGYNHVWPTNHPGLFYLQRIRTIKKSARGNSMYICSTTGREYENE